MVVEASRVKPKMVPPDKAEYSHEHVGSEYIGWLHFQTVFEELATTPTRSVQLDSAHSLRKSINLKSMAENSKLSLMLFVVSLSWFGASGQPTMENTANVERNVIFGMYSGLALVIDVYYPENPNGFGSRSNLR